MYHDHMLTMYHVENDIIVDMYMVTMYQHVDHVHDHVNMYHTSCQHDTCIMFNMIHGQHDTWSTCTWST